MDNNYKIIRISSCFCFCKRRIASNNISGRGGHIGRKMSTGIILSIPLTTEYESHGANIPPPHVQLPIAITYLGSGICLYNLSNKGAILCVIVPAHINKSACLGDGLNTSEPKRAISKLDAEAHIISIPQQEVANVSGHIEFERPQFRTVSIAVIMKFIFPPR